jgi:hypothetical protein
MNIWTEKNATRIEELLSGWSRLTDNSRMTARQVREYLESLDYLKLGRKFEAAAGVSSDNIRSKIKAAIKGRVCKLCQFRLLAPPKMVCKECYKTPEGRALMKSYKRKRTKKTCLEIYGAASVLESEEIKKRIKRTNLERYGVEHIGSSPEVRIRQIASLQRNHGKGITNPGQIPGHFKRITAKIQKQYPDLDIKGPISVPDYIEKRDAELIRKHGSLKEANRIKQEKVRKNALEVYGVHHHAAFPEFVEQRNKTQRKKYGGLLRGSPILLKKIEKTNLMKYGAKHPMQNPEVLNRALNNSFLIKEGWLNGRKIRYQGYELFVAKELEKVFGIGSVKSQFDGIPTIELSKGVFYQPDLYLKPRKALIEVKSTWTLYGGPEKRLKRNKELQRVANRKGIKFRFIVAFPSDKKAIVLPKFWYRWNKEQIISFLKEE